MEKIKLKLRVKHFNNTEYGTPSVCAIGKAAREYFGDKPEYVGEGVDELIVDEKTYIHKPYYIQNFMWDKFRIKLGSKRPERVIRTIVLKLDLMN